MPALVVLAAGMGSRYKGTKQLDPVGMNGETLLDYSVHDALSCGFDKLVFVIRADLERVFSELILPRYRDRVETVCVFQEMDALPEGYPRVLAKGRSKPWGTGHAVLVCKRAVTTPFCVVNADDFYGPAAYKSMAGFLKDVEPGRFSMVGFLLRNTLSGFGAVSRGVCDVGPDGELVSVTEITGIRMDPRAGIVHECGDRKLSGEEPVSLNFWGFTPDIFEELDRLFAAFLAKRGADPKAEFYLPDAVDAMIRERKARVKVLESLDRWVGMTFREDRQAVSDHLAGLTASGAYPERL
ncbi:MAG: NTP transferase domain-containing protein [Thermodesulfobacteriota bacterium]